MVSIILGADGDPDTLDNLAMRPSLEGNAVRCHADRLAFGGGSAAGVEGTGLYLEGSSSLVSKSNKVNMILDLHGLLAQV